MKNIILPVRPPESLAFYLAMEEFVAGHFDDEFFFVWRTAPTVIIGRNQVLESEVNLEYCRKNDIRVVRRKSGGGCVYSDRGNIMMTYITSRGDVSEVFGRFLDSITGFLENFGLDAERSGRNDIIVNGRKVSGNAFHQLPARSIVHGTLLYDTDMDALENAINPPREKLSRHGVASVRQRVGNLKDWIDPAVVPSVDSLMAILTDSFCDGEIILTQTDVEAIERMASEYQLE